MNKKNRKIRIFIYAILTIALSVVNGIGIEQTTIQWLPIYSHVLQSVQALFIAFILLEIAHLISRKTHILHFTRNIIFILTGVVIFSIFQDQLVTIGISIGILFGLLTIILQSAVVSIAGWIFLRATNTYKEGDRIKIGDTKGDVLDIRMGNTKLLEVSGEYVMNDLPSGRIVTIPNSKVLTETIINYSRIFPYIWTDIPFHVTYETDFPFVIKQIDEIMKKHLRGKQKGMNESFQKFLAKFDVENREFKAVQYNYAAMGSFIEFRVTFPVIPQEQSTVVTEITQEIMEMFNKYPEKVRFPKGRAR